jgi:hypothetical protein
MTLDDF